jgi:hypothetical protein
MTDSLGQTRIGGKATSAVSTNQPPSEWNIAKQTWIKRTKYNTELNNGEQGLGTSLTDWI